MTNQNYTSNLLCHFVGRSLPTDEERYKLLLKILKIDSKLYTNVKKPESPGLSALLKMNYQGENQGEPLTQCDCVCFCDIPDSSLGIHRKKYSSFGIGFSKSFLIKQGTRPVMYVPKNCQIDEFLNTKTPKNPAEYYITLERQGAAVTELLMMLDQRKPFKRQLEEIFSIASSDLIDTVNDFVLKPIANEFDSGKVRNLFVYLYTAWMTQCAYVKIFDDSLADDDINNYYMEREWRCLKNVDFALTDVNTIYLPNLEFKMRLDQDVPDFTGRVYIFE